MFSLGSIDDFNLLRETSSIEFKLAGGRDGNIEKLKAEQVFDPYLRSSSIGLTGSSLGLESSSSVLEQKRGVRTQ